MLNTPAAFTTSSPVQEIEIAEQAVKQEPEPTITPEYTQAAIRADLEDFGPAPEQTGNLPVSVPFNLVPPQ